MSKAAIVWKRRAREAKRAVATGQAKQLTRQQRVAVDESMGPTSRDREDKIVAGLKLLQQRLDHLGLQMRQVGDDGNCQFRSLSHQMFGTERYHLAVRHRTTEYMKEKEEIYSLYYAGDDWDGYLRELAVSRTWGDELSVKAACEAFNVPVHIVSSEQENWHLVYRPEIAEEDHKSISGGGSKPRKSQPAIPPKPVFMAYVSPIHYNSILLHEKAGMRASWSSGPASKSQGSAPLGRTLSAPDSVFC